MKSSGLKLLAFVFITVVIGCDRVYEVDYEVWNTSGESISIFIEQPGFKKDTNHISDDTRLIFLNVSAICCTTDEFMDKQTMLPFEISIVNSNGLNYNKDASDITIWSKLYPDKSDGIGKIQLRIRPEDFD